jgi:O-antigen/teichoic acid export membrane protein
MAASTIFYRAPDGRIVFRPWGARGACYLVTEAQRARFGKIQLAYYALMMLCIYFGVLRAGSLLTFAVILPAVTLGNYALFWLFSRNLPTTEPPPRPSPEYRRELLRQHRRAFGKPILWTMLILAFGMAGAGLWAGSMTGQWLVAAAAGVFFGGAGLFIGWQLKNL